MKRIVTIQDISCVGKCSLTVALPIISAMGIEAAILPTAVLSTHTMFSGFTVKDLTDQIKPITEHWKNEGITFDAMYTGYLGSFEQIDLMKEMADDFCKDGSLLFVDPAMADNGKLYPAFDEAFAKYMATLCARADIIVPNIPEACFMLGEEYKEKYDEACENLLFCLGADTMVRDGAYPLLVDLLAKQKCVDLIPYMTIEWLSSLCYIEPDEKKEFLADLGIEKSGLDTLVTAGYELLGLISYLTANCLPTVIYDILDILDSVCGKSHSKIRLAFLFIKLGSLGIGVICSFKIIVLKLGITAIKIVHYL